MPENQYDSEMLRAAAHVHRKTGETADGAGRDVAATNVAASPFGDVEGAGGYAEALGKARDHHARGAHAAATTARDRAGRADQTAGLGDRLVVETTAAANEGTVREVADGMS